jgi:hypothetical protein
MSDAWKSCQACQHGPGASAAKMAAERMFRMQKLAQVLADASAGHLAVHECSLTAERTLVDQILPRSVQVVWKFQWEQHQLGGCHKPFAKEQATYS